MFYLFIIILGITNVVNGIWSDHLEKKMEELKSIVVQLVSDVSGIEAKVEDLKSQITNDSIDPSLVASLNDVHNRLSAIVNS